MTIDEFKATIPEKEKRSRYFIEYRDDSGISDLLGGFASKESASKWISSLGDNLLWRVGFYFAVKQPRIQVQIVDKNREMIQP